MVAAVATASGRRVGLHTSPHLFHLNERLRLDGTPAPVDWIAGAVARYRTVMDEVRPSFFEAVAALSFLYFAEENVDLAVVEVGLGGRLDATNVIRPRLSLITNIALEHTDILGDTLDAIAREKAGIIKSGVPVLTAVDQPEVIAAIRAIADARHAPYHQLQAEVQTESMQSTPDGLRLRVQTPVRRYDMLETDLPGPHQATNALLAVRAAELLFDDLVRDPAPIHAGLRAVRRLAGLHGRLDILKTTPLVAADVAHNPAGLQTALHFVQSRCTRGSRLYVLLGAMRDKDVAGMADALSRIQAIVYPVHLDSERAFPAETLATHLRNHGVQVVQGGAITAGWAWFQHEATAEDVLLITGSHQVVAQIPTFLDWPPADSDSTSSS